ncbi:MAG: DUF4159 domain-containing protein [Lentisphaerae bacterium]|nr:DUF4159 domain-containing protein [Lentisphaerota bacterium]
MRTSRANVNGVVAGLCLLMLCGQACAAGRLLGTIGPPPRQKPQRQTSAEGLPPLPLPAVPLRRSEPKAEPSAPLFVGKLAYGKTQDYMPNPGDIDNLLRYVREQLDTWYGWQIVNIDELVAQHKEGKPSRIPLLYITGYQPFELTPDQREALRGYLLEGGTLVGDAALGSGEFAKSFIAEMRHIFPDRGFERLQLDHPLYRGYYPYSNVHYFTIREGVHTKTEGPPEMLGINIAARTAVILSPYDMTCGWDGFHAPAAPRRGDADPEATMAMMPGDAVRMGINLVAYVTAERRFATAQAETRSLTGDQPQRRAALPIAHLRHHGDWNPDPNSLHQLIRLASLKTSIPIDYKLLPVDAAVEQLIDTPVVLMTGMGRPRLNDKEIAALRRHIQAGGFLFVNNTSGFALFDREARALIASVSPDQKLESLTEDHPIFHVLYDVESMRDAGTLAERSPELEAVMMEGRAVIVYSKNDTLGMLKGVHDPYANAYDAVSARKLALNVLCYALDR